MEKIKEIFMSRRLWTIVGSVAVMAIVAFAYFYPDAARGNVLRQHDIQQGVAIGQEAKAYYEATGESTRWTNSLFSGMPTFQIAPSYPSNAWFSWLDTVFGLGLPQPANLLFMMMAGFFVLLMVMRMRWYVALIGAIAYGFSSYFVILIGAGHIWKFVTLAYIPPTIAGVVLCYRGRYLAGGAVAALFAMMQIASNHVQMTYYFLFVIFGFVIAYLITAVREKRLREWFAATGVLAVAAILAVAANLPSLYNTYEYSKETMRGGHSELSHPTDAANVTSGLDRDYITQYSYGTSETFTLLIPNVKGGATMKPEKGSNKIMSLGSLPEVKEMTQKGVIGPQEAQYLDYIYQYFGEPEGTNGPVYVGALIVALFLIGCVIVRGPMKWVLIALTLLSVLLALGRNCMWLTNFMIDYMPMYNKFRTVESILVIAEFTMPLLAVLALQKLLSGTPEEGWSRYRKPFLYGFGIVLVLCLAGIAVPGIYGSAITDGDRQTDAMISQSLAQQGADAAVIQQLSLNNPRIYAAVENLRHSMVAADSMRSFLIVAAGFGVLLLYFRRKLSLGVAAVGVGIIVLGDLFMVNKRYLDSDSFVPRTLARGEMFPLTETDKAILADTAMNYRVLNMPQFWQAAPSYRHKTIGGYHAAKLTRYQDLIDCHLTPFLQGSQSDADWNVVNMLNARYIVDYNGQPLVNDEALGNAWFVDEVRYVDGADAEMNALSEINPAAVAVADKRFRDVLGASVSKSPGDTIFETSYAPNRLTYHASTARGGVAVLSEVYFPWGWHAAIDGKPVEIGRVNYVLRALNIPAGEHTVELTFDPESLHNTTNIAYVAVVLIYVALIAAAVMCVVRKRKDDDAECGK